MKTPFKSALKITQEFGNDLVINGVHYYQKYGFKGHEGLDGIPADIGGLWEVCAVEEGMVVRDIDGFRDNYGIHVVILNTKTRRAWWYCHLEYNLVKIGDWVTRGQVIGKMGGSGSTGQKSFATHLHLGLRLADDNGNPTNLDNGYKGFVDPLPYLEEKEALMADVQDVTKLLEKYKVKSVQELDEVITKELGFLTSEREKTKRLEQDLDDRLGEIATAQQEIVKLQKEIVEMTQNDTFWKDVIKAYGVHNFTELSTYIKNINSSNPGHWVPKDDYDKVVKQLEETRDEFARQKEELKKLLTVDVKPYEPRDYFTLWIESLINKYFRR